jgi:hypothetical protein
MTGVDEQKMRKRKMVHLCVAAVFFLIILIFKIINKMALIDLVLEVAGYTYGPLLGLFAFGIFTHRIPKPKSLPWICIAAPVLTYLLKINSPQIFNGYQVGFEILPINGSHNFSWVFG